MVDGTLEKRWQRAVAPSGPGVGLGGCPMTTPLTSAREPWARLSGPMHAARWPQDRTSGGARHADAPDRTGAGSQWHPRAGGVAVPGAHARLARRCWPRWWVSTNDRAYLMPAGDVHGLSSGASVVAAAAYVPVPRLGERAAGLSLADAGMLAPAAGRRAAGPCGRCTGRSDGPMGPIAGCGSRAAGPQADQRHGPRAGARTAGHRCACHQCLADGGAWAAHRSVCRLWRGQERVAGHDGPLHAGRCDCGGADR